MLTTATLQGNEEAWKVQDFPTVLELARSHTLACLGGQFQFRFDDGTFEMYWLNAESEERKQNENWKQYVNRSIDEVLTQFERLCKQTDFEAEIQSQKFLSSNRLSGVEPMEHLFFAAYFLSRAEYEGG